MAPAEGAMHDRVVVLATYNSYGALRKPKEKSWEGRVKCWSWLMGCTDVMSQGPASGDGHGCAFSGLFAEAFERWLCVCMAAIKS